MNTNYKILKLKSGEELITTIVVDENKKSREILLENPMVFKSQYMTDALGYPREVTFLKNWLKNTDMESIKIPKSFIASMINPNESVINHYETEKKRSTEIKNQQQSADDIVKSFMDFFNTTKNMSDEENNSEWDDMTIEDIMNKIKGNDTKDAEEYFNDFVEDEFDIDDMEMGDTQLEDDSESNYRNLITMTLFLPPESLNKFVDMGMIDEEDVRDLIQFLSGNKNNKKRNDTEKISPAEYTGDNDDRKSSEDFGNIWTDWSPDLKDYLK